MIFLELSRNFKIKHFFKRNLLLKSIGFSFGAHFVLFAILILVQIPSFIDHHTVLVDFDYKQNKTVATKTKHKNNFALGKTLSSTQKLSHLSAKDLGLSSINTNLFKKSNVNSTVDQTSFSLNQVDWKNPSNYLYDEFHSYEGLSMDKIRFEKSLWKEIDQSVLDSSFLSEYNHTGKIHLKFELDQSGKLIESSFRACGADNVLKVLAARAIRKALLNEHSEIYFPNENSKLFMQFTWADYETCKSTRGINKNFLSFCHYAENMRKDFSSTEKLTTILKSLQYGFGAIEEIQKYKKEEFRSDTQFDPFLELRHDPDWNIEC